MDSLFSTITLSLSISLDLSTLVQVVLQGLLIGGFYGLIAIGMNVIFGVMNIINISQGDFVVLGAFVAFWFYSIFGLSPLVALPAIAILLFVISIPVYRVLMKGAMKISIDTALIVAFGISLILQNLMTEFWSGDTRLVTLQFPNIAVQGFTIPARFLLVFVISIISSLSLYTVLRKTFIGKAIIAVSLDSRAAALVGADTERIQQLSFGISFFMAGVAGALLSFLYPFVPTSGGGYTFIAFVIVILGGVGNPIGSMVGGLILGVVGSVSSLFGPGWSTFASFLLFVIVLLLKPEGLFQRFGA
jgi:branched-chain amino acid transport system permease protein